MIQLINPLKDIRWNSVLDNNLSEEQLLNIFYKKLNNIMEKNIPKTLVKYRTYPELFNTEFKIIAHKYYKPAIDTKYIGNNNAEN